MEKKHQNITKPPHVLLFPYPSQGHINPIIQFGKRLLSKGVKTTLVTTVYHFNSSHNTTNTSIQIKPISDGFDEGGYASADSPESYLKTFKETGSKSLANLINNLQSEGNNVDAIIYDSMIIWALDVAKELGIKCGSFFTQACGVIEWMRKMWNLKVIGPTIPSMYLDKRIDDDIDYGFSLFKANHDECMNWLNDKPKKSVVYLSFGSSAKLGPEQMEEISWGLIDSNVNFLWVVRAKEENKLPKDFVDILKTGKGLVVPWCTQLDVLAHESVGCFVTHCGFNSTLEALSLGVPIVGMPQWTDQITNAMCLDKVWGVGVRVKADENGVVRRGNLVSCIKKIMEEERGVVAMKNATKWRELAKLAVDEGGSSDKDVDEFVGTNGKVYCYHNLLAAVRQAGTCAARPGEEFYECPYALGRFHCSLFVWKHDVDNIILQPSERRVLQSEYERLERDKDVLEREVAGLKAKVNGYEEVVAEKRALQSEHDKVGMEKCLLEREVIGLKSKIDTYEAALVKVFGGVALFL
ncbi:hypothetical protein M8C21_028081, partial [Ambrosia artemisiifolia]